MLPKAHQGLVQAKVMAKAKVTCQVLGWGLGTVWDRVKHQDKRMGVRIHLNIL